MIEVLQDRIHTLLDIPNLGPYFFAPPNWDDPVAVEFYSSMNTEIYRTSLLPRLNDADDSQRTGP